MTADSYFRSPLAKWVSALAVTVSLVLVAFKLRESWSALALWKPSCELLVAATLGSVAYGFIGILLSTSWHLLTTACSNEEISARTSYRVYARSQLAKYVPGNLVQMAGRHVLGHRAGASHAALMAASFYELAGLLSAAGIIVFLGVSLFAVQTENIPMGLVMLGVLSVAGLAGALAVLKGSSRVRRMFALSLDHPQAFVRHLSVSFGLYSLFFLGGGAIFFALMAAVADIPDWPQVGTVVAAYALSWAVGFLTPGAPAGLGVREAVLVTGLDNILGSSTALIAALALRLVTVCGDLLFFTGSFLVRDSAETTNTSVGCKIKNPR